MEVLYIHFMKVLLNLVLYNQVYSTKIFIFPAGGEWYNSFHVPTGPAQLDFTVDGLKPISEGHSFHFAGAPYKYLYGGVPYKSPKIAENPSFRPTSEGHSYYHRPENQVAPTRVHVRALSKSEK
jgi:hypothetical protein